MLLEDQARSGSITVVVARQSTDKRATIKFDSIIVPHEGFQDQDNRHSNVR